MHNTTDHQPGHNKETQGTHSKTVIDRGLGLEFHLRPRRVTIEPHTKREEYIQRLDHALTMLEETINAEETPEKTRIQAANTLARVVSTSYTIIRDIDIERLEKELQELAEEDSKKEEPRDPGYKIEAEDGLTHVWDDDQQKWIPETGKKSHKIQPQYQR